jgi:4a-hydroxytetrahydrobiopterin dehydratase
MEWAAIYERLQRLRAGWHVSPQGHLERAVRFPDFAKALEFANRVGALAEAAGHHPDIHISWGMCTIETWTHDVDGLTEKDFSLAAKVDELH